MRSDQEENNKQTKQQKSAETVADPDTNQSMHDDESIKEVKKENTIMNDENVSSTAATS